ncbi:MAG: hypothetical protein HC897_03150 [Thermoanaerobaculia bacterium]|nr:hypothetical protein [Thermoanaerobaculia bacterium]
MPLDGLLAAAEIPPVLEELEKISAETQSGVSVAALHILKNEMHRVALAPEARRIECERIFYPPGGLGHQLRNLRHQRGGSALGLVKGALEDVRFWFRGTDAERFRDRCDEYFWEVMVPEIESRFGRLAGPMANTINEAIMNYAEYSFGRWAVRRRIKVHLFKTEGELGYAILRPLGTRMRTFDPLALKTKHLDDLHTGRRGWGFTIMLGQALFISFDHSPHRRGMMIIVGPEG